MIITHFEAAGSENISAVFFSVNCTKTLHLGGTHTKEQLQKQHFYKHVNIIEGV
jgi:hypothetical protein